jgi:penicillin-binding protein 1B
MAKRNAKLGAAAESPQVALICLDPHTGEVKALVGGRNYGQCQFDHVTARRPSGSIFKPIVYAAAFNTALFDEPNAITASTIVSDSPQTFAMNGQPDYTPTDFHKDEWMGDITVRAPPPPWRWALMMSRLWTWPPPTPYSAMTASW